MRSRLSYYSVLVLVGLAIVAVLIFAMNPFNGAPASASPSPQGVSTTAGGSSPLVSNGSPASASAGGGLSRSGTSHGQHHHEAGGFVGSDVGAGNSTATTTTATIFSQNE